MDTPRLRGRALEAALRLVRTRPGLHLVRQQTLRAYGIDRMHALPVALRPPLEDTVAPIAAAAPRAWADAELGPLPASRGRESARRLQMLYRQDALRPSAVLERVLARVRSGRFGEATFSPFAALDEDRVREDARASDARWDRGEPLSPLDGVLVPVKDEVDVAGLSTRGGTAYLDGAAANDSVVVATLRAAGALVYGKTHTTEWGMNPVGINPHFDMPRNVYDRQRAAGGSSTGSGAAVALGLATVALGSDGGGSIRIPASVQGVFGLKPTFQRLSRTGDVYGRGTVAVCGPLAQSCADLADFMAVTAQPDPLDWATQQRDPSSLGAALDAALGRGVEGARIGIPRREWEDADTRVAAICMDALEALEQEGAQLVDIDVPAIEFAQAAGVLSIGPETFANLVDDRLHHGDRMSLELHVLLEILGSLAAREYLMAQRVRLGLRRSVARALLDVDLIALPTLPEVARPYPLAENRLQVQDEVGTRRMCRYAFLANITGLPAATCPVGMHEGLPVGLQFVADAWDEASALAVLSHAERMGLTGLPVPTGWETLLDG